MSEKESLKIANTDRIDGDALIVTYSNDTTAIYTTEQIAALAPLDPVSKKRKIVPLTFQNDSALLVSITCGRKMDPKCRWRQRQKICANVRSLRLAPYRINGHTSLRFGELGTPLARREALTALLSSDS